MFGISLISIFTAAVTNVMWEVLGGQGGEISIQGANIGVITGSIERELVLQQGGNPIGISLEKHPVFVKDYIFHDIPFYS